MRRTIRAITVGLALAPTALSAEPLRKGPWLMDSRLETDGRASIVVMAERTTPGPLRVRVEPVDLPPDRSVHESQVVDDPSFATLHEVTVRGLRPHGRYWYIVDSGGNDWQRGTFTAAIERGIPYRFVLYGDTRSDHETHAAIAHAVALEHPVFVLHTGDLLEDGRRDELWQRFFTIEHDLLRDTVFVPVIGNHEIISRDADGIDHFRRYVHCEPTSPSPELDYLFAQGDVRVLAANAYDDWSDPTMRAWVGGQLDRARAEVPDGFVIVAMHWGLCSSGPHGENRRMRTAGIAEFLRAHHVDLLVSGHDHLYERGDDAGLRYVVSGGSGAPLYPQQSVRPYTQKFASEYHYVRIDVEPGRLDLTALRLDGSVLDHCPLTHAGWACAPPLAPPPPPVVEPPAAPSPAPPPPESHGVCGCRTAGSSRAPRRASLLVLGAAVFATVRRCRPRRG